MKTNVILSAQVTSQVHDQLGWYLRERERERERGRERDLQILNQTYLAPSSCTIL